jgi:hypothetical protein
MISSGTDSPAEGTPEHSIVAEVFDVFLCYNWDDDKAWADELHADLTARDVRVFQDDKNIPFGDTLDPALRTALLGSRMLVPLIGPHFHESPSCRHELLTALTAAYRLEEGTTERVMPVTWHVRPSALRPRQLKRPMLLTREKHDVAEQAEFIVAKLAQVKAADDRRFGDAPTYPEPRWYPKALPTNRRFHGRGEVMWELHEALLVKDKPGNRGHPVVSVRGSGGWGKTALCEQYARWFADDHPGGVFLIRLGGSDRRIRSDPRMMISQFHLALGSIARSLGLPAGPDSDATLAAIAGEVADRPPYLWIVDDVPSNADEEQLESLTAPTDNGQTLLSTRGTLANVVSVEVDLEPLDQRACLHLLTNERPVTDQRTAEREAANGIVDDLGRHTLGLTIAAGLTTLPTFSGYPALRADLRQAIPDALELAAHLKHEVPAGYAKPFSATLTRSFDKLTDAGRDVLAVSSVLGPAPIPLDLVDGILMRPSRSPADEGMRRLSAHGLATDLDDGSYLVHALVARAARFRLPTSLREELRNHACELIGDELEAARTQFDRTRSTASHLPHVLPLASTVEWPSGRTQWHVLNESGRSQYELGDTTDAFHSLEIFHEQIEQSPEVDENTRLMALVSLGAAHFGQGNLSEAQRIQQESVRRFEEMLGGEHQHTLQAKENLANTFSERGERNRAREILTDIYRSRCTTQGTTDRATLITLNNLVLAVGRCGAHQLALRMALGAWALWHRAVGPDDPETLTCVENIGNNLQRLEQTADAAATHAYVAARRSEVLGPNHPDTIDARENVATARGSSYWPIYADRLRVQGPDHLDALKTLLRLLRASMSSPSATAASVAARTPVAELADAPVTRPSLDGEHTELLADIVGLAVDLEAREEVHGPGDPRALRAKILLTHALAAANQYEGQIDVALVIVADSRDGLEEAAARAPQTIEPHDLAIAESVHHWILELQGEEPDY